MATYNTHENLQDLNIVGFPPECGANEAMPDGLTWQDMPGGNEFFRRCNFFFYRRKMLALVEDADGKLFNAQNTGRRKVKGKAGRRGLA